MTALGTCDATTVEHVLNDRCDNATPIVVTGKCAWWALCPNEATTTEPHPILGAVPICERCATTLRSLDAGR